MTFFRHLILFVFGASSVSNAQNQSIEMEFVVTHDLAANMAGGVRQKATHLGNIDLVVQTKLWDKGTWFFYGLSNYGGALSAAVGDLQVTNNIEAGPYTRLYEFGYRHEFNKFSLSVGQQDFNAVFAFTDNGLLFINSSFGIQPDLSTNYAIPIFPVAALGLVGQWDYSSKSTLLFGLYDGDPGTESNNPNSLNFRLGKKEGYFGAVEWQHTTHITKKPTKLRTGIWHNGGSTERENLTGFYTIIDHKLWSPEAFADSGLNIFAQWGIVGANAPVFKSYFGMGLVYNGLINSATPDALGIAYARANTSSIYRATVPNAQFEGVLELTYSMPWRKKWNIQPNLQWVLHPGATSTLQNALVGVLRFEYTIL